MARHGIAVAFFIDASCMVVDIGFLLFSSFLGQGDVRGSERHIDGGVDV